MFKPVVRDTIMIITLVSILLSVTACQSTQHHAVYDGPASERVILQTYFRDSTSREPVNGKRSDTYALHYALRVLRIDEHDVAAYDSIITRRGEHRIVIQCNLTDVTPLGTKHDQINMAINVDFQQPQYKLSGTAGLALGAASCDPSFE